MIVLEEQGLNGYDAEGLNGLKIAKFLKTNIKSAKKDISIKNAIKVVKTVAPMALSLIPVAGGVLGGAAGKILNKVTTNANGSANLIGRIATGTSSDGTQNLVGRITTQVKQISKTDIGKSAIKLASPLVKNAKAALLEQTGAIPTDAQLQTLADQKGTTPQQELDAIVAAAPITPASTPAKDNTMLYVGGGILAAGIAYVAFK